MIDVGKFWNDYWLRILGDRAHPPHLMKPEGVRMFAEAYAKACLEEEKK